VKSGILSLLYDGRDGARLQESIKAEAAQMQINGGSIVYAAIVDLFMYGEILLLIPEVKLPAAAITKLLILQKYGLLCMNEIAVLSSNYTTFS
jgi:hypothetical protein